MKMCSIERGCKGKANLGTDSAKAAQYAERMKTVFGKDYGVYRCPHCGGTHLTTKLHKKEDYPALLHTTDGVSELVPERERERERE